MLRSELVLLHRAALVEHSLFENIICQHEFVSHADKALLKQSQAKINAIETTLKFIKKERRQNKKCQTSELS